MWEKAVHILSAVITTYILCERHGLSITINIPEYTNYLCCHHTIIGITHHIRTWLTNEDPQRCIPCTACTHIHIIRKFTDIRYYKLSTVNSCHLMHKWGGAICHRHTIPPWPGRGGPITVAYHSCGIAIGCISKEWVPGEEHWIVQGREGNATCRDGGTHSMADKHMTQVTRPSPIPWCLRKSSIANWLAWF